MYTVELVVVIIRFYYVYILQYSSLLVLVKWRFKLTLYGRAIGKK